jgi:hypothetical protein
VTGVLSLTECRRRRRLRLIPTLGAILVLELVWLAVMLWG